MMKYKVYKKSYVEMLERNLDYNMNTVPEYSVIEKLNNEIIELKLNNKKLIEAQKLDEVRKKSESFYYDIMQMVDQCNEVNQFDLIIKLRKMCVKSLFIENLRYRYFDTENRNDYPNSDSLFKFIISISEYKKIEKPRRVYLEDDVVITWPWNKESLWKMPGKFMENGFVFNANSHEAVLYLEQFDFFIAGSGNHSLTAGGILETGYFRAKSKVQTNLENIKYKRCELEYYIDYDDKCFEVKCNTIYEVLIFELSVRLANIKMEAIQNKNSINFSGQISYDDLKMLIDFILKTNKLQLTNKNNRILKTQNEEVEISKNLVENEVEGFFDIYLLVNSCSRLPGVVELTKYLMRDSPNNENAIKVTYDGYDDCLKVLR